MLDIRKNLNKLFDPQRFYLWDWEEFLKVQIKPDLRDMRRKKNPDDKRKFAQRVINDFKAFIAIKIKFFNNWEDIEEFFASCRDELEEILGRKINLFRIRNDEIEDVKKIIEHWSYLPEPPKSPRIIKRTRFFTTYASNPSL